MSDTPRWFKSSYSNMVSGCVEVAVMDTASWFTSSFSSIKGGNCVEVAFVDPAVVLVRDTRNRDSAVFTVGSLEWSGWVRSVAGGRSLG